MILLGGQMQRRLAGDVGVVQVGAAVNEERSAGPVIMLDGYVEKRVARR